jgi:hypothetical protein
VITRELPLGRGGRFPAIRTALIWKRGEKAIHLRGFSPRLVIQQSYSDERRDRPGKQAAAGTPIRRARIAAAKVPLLSSGEPRGSREPR